MGWYPIDAGRPASGAAIGYRAPPPRRAGRLCPRLGLPGYIFAVAGLTTFGVLGASAALSVGAGVPAVRVIRALATLRPGSDAMAALVDRLVLRMVWPSSLPGLSLTAGVPRAMRTLVAGPTLLMSPWQLAGEFARLGREQL